jgi:hypothetical protein
MVSVVGDYFGNTLPTKEYWPHVNPLVQPVPFPQQQFQQFNLEPQITRQDFDALKHDLKELKKMLVAAKKYDEATGQPDCEMEIKVALIKKLAEVVGVDLGDVFGK